jgi:ABC-type branched-subunit amino acid transport system substrate-binding protein
LRSLAGLAAIAAFAISGCAASGGGVASDAPLAVYLSVPLCGQQAEQGKALADAAEKALADAGGKAGSHPIELKVLDDTGGTGGWTPVAAAADARQANEDASTIAYVGDLDQGASRTSLPITNLADIAQIVLGPVPRGLDVANLVDAPSVHGDDPGRASIELLLAAIDKAGSGGGDRKKVLDELKTAAANQAAGSAP